MTTRPATTAALSACLLAAGLLALPGSASADESPSLELVGRYVALRTPEKPPLEEDDIRAEVTAVLGDRMYVVNHTALDIVDISDPSAPALLRQVSLAGFGGSITSVATSPGRVAIAIPHVDKTLPGTVVLLNPAGRVLRTVAVGANPDMLTFDATGKRLVVANEGEPSGYGPGFADPEGSVSIIDVKRVLGGRPDAVRTVGFGEFNSGTGTRTLDPAVRIFGPGATVAQDLEPEYVTLRGDRAFVSLQENNAIAEIDLTRGEVLDILPLALKDHSLPGNGLDPSDRDSSIRIATWPVFGMPMPDALASFTHGGQAFLVTANEGDARDWPGYSDEVRVNNDDYLLDPVVFPNAASLKVNTNLGRLNVSTTSGNLDDAHFNSTSDDNNTFDGRSDNKGPEPEGVAVGVVDGRRMAFVGLERVGGLVVFDITDPQAPVLVEYVTSRDFDASPTDGSTDSGPEVVTFVPAEDSPSGRPLVLVSNEWSGSVTLFSPRS